MMTAVAALSLGGEGSKPIALTLKWIRLANEALGARPSSAILIAYCGKSGQPPIAGNVLCAPTPQQHPTERG
jgi:hypothetical protein